MNSKLFFLFSWLNSAFFQNECHKKKIQLSRHNPGKGNFGERFCLESILFPVLVLILSQCILDGMRAASGHWLLRYSLILKKASGWGHYCLITICDYWRFLQWPYFVRWPIVHQRIHAAGNFGWLESISRGFFEGGGKWGELDLKTVLAEMSTHFSPIWIWLITVLVFIYFSHISCVFEVCLNLSKCCFKYLELGAEAFFYHYLLFVGITGEVFLGTLQHIRTCSYRDNPRLCGN